MTRQSTLWVFQDDVTIKHSIIVQVGSYCEPTVIKICTDDALFYTVDYDTYDKWRMWYSMKAKEIVQKLPTDKFELVLVFDSKHYMGMSNLN